MNAETLYVIIRNSQRKVERGARELILLLCPALEAHYQVIYIKASLLRERNRFTFSIRAEIKPYYIYKCLISE